MKQILTAFYSLFLITTAFFGPKLIFEQSTGNASIFVAAILILTVVFTIRQLAHLLLKKTA